MMLMVVKLLIHAVFVIVLSTGIGDGGGASLVIICTEKNKAFLVRLRWLVLLQHRENFGCF